MINFVLNGYFGVWWRGRYRASTCIGSSATLMPDGDPSKEPVGLAFARYG